MCGILFIMSCLLFCTRHPLHPPPLQKITITPHLFKILPHFDRIRNFQVTEVTITKYQVTKLPVSDFIMAGVKDCLVIITWYTKVTVDGRGED